MSLESTKTLHETINCAAFTGVPIENVHSDLKKFVTAKQQQQFSNNMFVATACI
jgi:hypothetical protein